MKAPRSVSEEDYFPFNEKRECKIIIGYSLKDCLRS